MSWQLLVTIYFIAWPLSLIGLLLVTRIFGHWWWMRRYYRPVVGKRSERWQR